MVYLRSERIQTEAFHKLKLKKYGLFKIIEKISDNVYIVNLSSDMAMFKTLHVAALY